MPIGVYARVPLELRFWSKVVKGAGCWGWTGAVSRNGYGKIGAKDKLGRKGLIAAHRLSWEIANGPIPEGKCVLHTCDNPQCTNPKHLFLGTRRDNILDMWKKGRAVHQASPEKLARGVHHGLAVLDEKKVRRIRKERQEGKTLEALASSFGVGLSTIRKVVDHTTWAHVSD